MEARELFDICQQDAAAYTEALEAYFEDDTEALEDEDAAAMLDKLRDACPDNYYTIEYTIGSGQYLKLEIFTDRRECRRAFLVRTDWPNSEEVQLSDRTADRLAQFIGAIEI